MSGELNTEEVLEGVVGPNEDGVLVMSHVDDDLSSGRGGEGSGFDGSRDKEGAANGGAATDDSSDQDSSYVQVDRVETSNDSMHTDSDDMKITDDAGKEDMFVDAPDELNASAQATDSEDTTERSVEGTRFYEEGGMQSYQIVDEVGHLRSSLEKVISENNALYREKQEERKSSMKEIADIRQLIKGIADQHLLIGEPDGGSIENLREGEDEDTGAEIPLSKYVKECSESLKRALEGRLQREEEIRELHENLDSKEKEISDLKSQISQLSLSKESQEEITQVQTQNYLYAEAVLTQLLTSLSTVVYQGELIDESVGAKALMVESSLSVLIQNYTEIVYGIEQLRQFLNRGADAGQEDYRTILSATLDELRELKIKDEELLGKFIHLEAENKDLHEKLQIEKQAAAVLNAEVAKMKTELDQEKAKSGNLREKLSLAVTKGKGLVQQRDSLRQSLAEKTRELDDSLEKLREASRSLEVSENRIVDLVACENMLTYLQESISLKDSTLADVEGMLSLANVPENIQFLDLSEKVKWIVDERSALTEASSKLHRIEDVIASFDFPETITSLDVASRISWLKEASDLANSEIIKLQEELAKVKEAADIEIYRLTTSLSDVIQANEFMKMELTNLSEKLEVIVQKERHLLKERDDVVKMLLDASGNNPDNEENLMDSSSDLPRLIEKLLSKTVEQSSRSVESSLAQTEDYERKITMLYMKNLELTLCLQLLEEDDLERSQFKEQLHELKLASEKLAQLKDERDSLQKDLSRAEDKVSTLREKLSMAVKKGKGLVQERENIKGNLDEKNQEIEKLKHEIQQLESQLSDHFDTIRILSVDMERIPQLETETLSIKDQRDQLEKLLEEKEEKIRVLIESIQSITLPTDLVSDNPLEKLKMIGSYLSEFEAYKLKLEKAKHKASDVDAKLTEADSVIKSMEDRAFDIENNLSRVTSEKNELEIEKAMLEKELQKLLEESQDQSMKLSEASATMKSLQEALSQAEADVRELSLEKEEANAGKIAAEMELEKAREEVANHTSKLTEAYTTVKTLEEKLSRMELDISLLNEKSDQRQQEDKSIELQKLKTEISSQAEELVNTRSTIKLLKDAASKAEDEKKMKNEEISALISKLTVAYETIKAHESTITQLETRISSFIKENSEGQATRSHLEAEIQKFKEDNSSLEADLTDARTIIKSLEDAAADAKTDMSVLVEEKGEAEALASELQTKLNTCLDELSGTHGNIQSRCMEVIRHLKDLHSLATNDSLGSWRKRFQMPLENLHSMDLVLGDIRNHFEDTGHSAQPDRGQNVTDSSIAELLTDVPTIDSSDMTSEQVDEVNKLFTEVAYRLHTKDRCISETVEGFCTMLDTYTESLLQKLQLSKNEILGLADHLVSSKKTAEELELKIQEKDKTIASLENDLSVFASVADEAEKHLMHLCSTPELGFASHDAIPEASEAESDYKVSHGLLENVIYAETAKNLLLVTQKVHNLIMLLLNSQKMTTTTISELQNELNEARSSLEQHTRDKDLNLSRVSKLEADLQDSQSLCDELSLEIENHKANEKFLTKKEADVSFLYNNLLSKEHGTEDSHASTAKLIELLDKASGVDFPFEDPEGVTPRGTAIVKKLGFIIENFLELQRKLVLLSQDRQELEATIGQQKSEIRHLQEEIIEHSKINLGSQKAMNEFSEFSVQLERVVMKLGGADVSENQTPDDARRFLSVVDNLTEKLLLEYENSKSEVRQLRAKLVEGQKVVDNLSVKVHSLEELIQSQKSMPQAIQERSFAVPSPSAASEITEVEEVDLSGKSTITPVPSAAQMRTFRKGSTDHLALNIDPESVPLISNVGTDEDKGHVFKSLSTTGLIPKQGKLIADQIDGYWVNGGRVLMNKPRARLGVIAYWLILHLWLLASIL